MDTAILLIISLGWETALCYVDGTLDALQQWQFLLEFMMISYLTTPRAPFTNAHFGWQYHVAVTMPGCYSDHCHGMGYWRQEQQT